MKIGHHLKVLIVDDDVLICNVVRDLLEEAGHPVAGTAHDGRQAIEMVQSLRPDMVFMDIKMPEMDGLEATRLIQAQCPTPVILLTAYDDPELVEQGSRVGAVAYLVKPPSLGEMTRTMAMAWARFADLRLLAYANEELKSCLRDIRVLHGVLHICNRCKRICNDAGGWEAVDTYLSAHTNLQFIQAICPDCVPLLSPDQPFPRLNLPPSPPTP
jgi:CheY-like chemotaxis protein